MRENLVKITQINFWREKSVSPDWKLILYVDYFRNLFEWKGVKWWVAELTDFSLLTESKNLVFPKNLVLNFPLRSYLVPFHSWPICKPTSVICKIIKDFLKFSIPCPHRARFILRLAIKIPLIKRMKIVFSLKFDT